VVNYFQSVEDRGVTYSADVTMLQPPKHGHLQTHAVGTYDFIPDIDYSGLDEAVFQLSIAGMTVRVVYSIHVVHKATDNSQYCPSYVWRIAKAA
jgi:hypothetical protein